MEWFGIDDGCSGCAYRVILDELFYVLIGFILIGAGTRVLVFCWGFFCRCFCGWGVGSCLLGGGWCL